MWYIAIVVLLSAGGVSYMAATGFSFVRMENTCAMYARGRRGNAVPPFPFVPTGTKRRLQDRTYHA